MKLSLFNLGLFAIYCVTSVAGLMIMKRWISEAWVAQ